MSALIRKSNLEKTNPKVFKGGSSEKKEVLREIKSSGMSESKMNKLLKDEYGYQPQRRKKIINAITGQDGDKSKGPQELTWREKQKLKEEQRKIERKELEKQRKVEAEEEEKRAKRAKASGLMARRMEDSDQGGRMNFIGSQNKRKEIGGDKAQSKGGFASQPSKGGSSSAKQSSSGGFALGGASSDRDNFFRKN